MSDDLTIDTTTFTTGLYFVPDDGRQRKATFNRLAACLDALDGIEDPAAELARLREIERCARDFLRVYDDSAIILFDRYTPPLRAALTPNDPRPMPSPAAFNGDVPDLPACRPPEDSTRQRTAGPTFDEDPMNHPPLRIPSIYPGKWTYLRAPSTSFGNYDRTYTSGCWECFVGNDIEAGCTMPTFCAVIKDGLGLRPWVVHGFATKQGAIDALEAHLMALGAEPVPDNEWPTNCEGDGYRADRPPVTLDDLRPVP